jgi:hypothetical protein
MEELGLFLKGWCREFQAVETANDSLATFEDSKKEMKNLPSEMQSGE